MCTRLIFLTLLADLELKIQPYPSRLKNKMKPAYEELVERGFLEDFEFVKVGKYHRVKFYKAGSVRSYQASLFELPGYSLAAESPTTYSEDDIWEAVRFL